MGGNMKIVNVSVKQALKGINGPALERRGFCANFQKNVE